MEVAETQDWRQLLDALIDDLKANGSLRDPRVEDAFRAVPRHDSFVATALRPVAACTG